MQKIYVVRLTEEEREQCREAVRKLSGGSQKSRRARILLQADEDGTRWTARRISEACSCRQQTVENVRRRFVLDGFAAALERKRPAGGLQDGPRTVWLGPDAVSVLRELP